MKKNSIFAIIAVAIIAIIGGGIYWINKDDDKSEVVNSSVSVDMDSDMYKMYSALNGEYYDRMFIANMIAHHQGAVDMAELALTSAKHQEIKDMANNIISAQTKEIDEMEAWQKDWGYPVSSGPMMQDHSSMGMMGEMASMTDELAGLSDDEFDKTFLSLMIEHHQSAIDMAYSGQTNAQHQEVKTLTKNIVDAQSEEIAQMKQWQQEWGY